VESLELVCEMFAHDETLSGQMQSDRSVLLNVTPLNVDKIVRTKNCPTASDRDNRNAAGWRAAGVALLPHQKAIVMLSTTLRTPGVAQAELAASSRSDQV
jgi:hypothetical protein